MKRIVSAIAAVLLTVMNLQVFAQGTLEYENGIELKNTVISAWDFSDGAQISGEADKTDIPVISGGAEYNQENENIRLNASSSATGVNLNLSEPITAEMADNIINVEFDMNFGSISGQSFSYSIDSTMETIIYFNFEPYKDSGTGEAIIKYGYPICTRTEGYKKGEHVHTHNIATNLSGKLNYEYNPIDIK